MIILNVLNKLNIHLLYSSIMVISLYLIEKVSQLWGQEILVTMVNTLQKE